MGRSGFHVEEDNLGILSTVETDPDRSGQPDSVSLLQAQLTGGNPATRNMKPSLPVGCHLVDYLILA